MENSLKNIRNHAKDRVVISVPINGGISHTHLREFKTIKDVRDIIGKYFEVREQKVFSKPGNVSSVVFITNLN